MKNLRDKRLMIIGGGEWQVPIIAKAKALGIWVGCTNLYEDSPGFKFADSSEVCDVLDKEKQLQIAKDWSIDGVTTDQSDIAVPSVAFVADQLNLRGIGVDTAEKFTNKVSMRSAAQSHITKQPRFTTCHSVAEAEKLWTGSPIVFKPTSSQSSRGVSTVDQICEIPSAFDFASEYSNRAGVLVEEYIDGQEITVEGFASNGEHTTLAISVKEHFQHNPMVAKRLTFRIDHESIATDKLIAQHNSLIEHMGLEFGITHTEYLIKDGEFYLVETAARGGGTLLSSHVIPAISGVDANELLISEALGEETPPPIPSSHYNQVTLQFEGFEPGLVKSIEGIEEAKNLEGVLSLTLNFGIGSKLAPASDDRSRHMHCLIASHSEDEFTAIMKRVRELIRIDYES